PVLLHVQGDRSRRLTLIGYAGILVPLVILNIGEGSVEGFVKPYLAKHGGLPGSDLPGLADFEAPALIVVLVGTICLAVAVFRARVLPVWVAVAFFAVPLLAVSGMSGAVSLIPDYLLFAALFAVGLHALRAAPAAGGEGASADGASPSGRLRRAQRIASLRV
ncbi:MAG: hypothetical protein ABR571_06180, partial [Jatrophihabitans sp.]